MEQKLTTHELIESLYAYVQTEFTKVNEKLDRIEGRVSGHDGRISALEDSMRVVKTKLGFN
jgi:hypothetical protein